MGPRGSAGCAASRPARGHACCLYDDVEEYRRRLVAFFADGLRAGCRVAYAGPGGAEQSRADLAGLPDLDRRLDDGSVRISSLQDLYGHTLPVDPDRVVGLYAAATEQALTDGFRGLRVGADGSELVRRPAHLDALTRYEFLADRYMAGRPLSALCGYRLDLGHDTVRELASLHRTCSSGGTGFTVSGCADGAVGLGGQFDPGSVPVLRRLLTRIRAGVDDGVLVVDMAGVEYVDHRLLRTLSAHARAHGVALSLRSAPPFTARLVELLATRDLHLAEVGAEP
ncbi:MEDS domain-containing protein [Geodermatophilus sp. URMC 61]|uniref:MEDS domain-containing protein n=1 Tax=Geodermatophilus sp. URMC 61 TaxID=3423411 RepID=UPI00406CECBB